MHRSLTNSLTQGAARSPFPVLLLVFVALHVMFLFPPTAEGAPAGGECSEMDSMAQKYQKHKATVEEFMGKKCIEPYRRPYQLEAVLNKTIAGIGTDESVYPNMVLIERCDDGCCPLYNIPTKIRTEWVQIQIRTEDNCTKLKWLQLNHHAECKCEKEPVEKQSIIQDICD